MKSLNSMMVILGVGMIVCGLTITKLNAFQIEDPGFGIDVMIDGVTVKMDSKCVTLLDPKCSSSGDSACDAADNCPDRGCGSCNVDTALPNKVCLGGFRDETCTPNATPGVNCFPSQLLTGRCRLKNGDCRCSAPMPAGACPETATARACD